MEKIYKEFIRHYSVCQSCKNTDTYITKDNNKTIYNCPFCKATWTIREPTKKYLIRFYKFKHNRYIF